MKRLATLVLPLILFVLAGCAKERVFDCHSERPFFGVLKSQLHDSDWVFTSCYPKGNNFQRSLLTDSTLLKKKEILENQPSYLRDSDTAWVWVRIANAVDTALWFGNYDWKIYYDTHVVTLTEIVQPRTKFATTDIHGTPSCSSPIVQMKVNAQLLTGEAAQHSILIH